MLNAIEVSLISAAIAALSLIVAALALWRTHFALLKPISIAGQLRHRIYPIKSEGDRWFLSSFDIPVSFCNPGAQPILLTGMRLTLHFPGIPIPSNREIIHAKWDIDPDDAARINKNRFQWIEDLTPKDAMTFAVLPKGTVLKHVVFEARWDDPVIQKVIEVKLEAISSAAPGWTTVAKWRLNLDAVTWGELSNVGTSISYFPEGSTVNEDKCSPPDLHKYTGSKDAIPDKGFEAANSYLDFPRAGSDKRDNA